jgi:hypothetical protein
MLPQKFQRRDAETQRKKRFIYRDEGDERGYEKTEPLMKSLSSPSSLLNIALRLCVSAFLIAFISCGSKPTDVRTVVPSDALVYLETNDLGKAIGAITDSRPFTELAKSKPDLSALNGIKMAIAVTGFETSEQEITEENSVLNFRPHFVAVVETNAWSWQAESFAENKVGEFINDAYGGEVVLEVTPSKDGKYFVWTAQDGRKAYALLQGSTIYFGNDESSIEKCQAVKRGEAEPISKNAKIAALPADSLSAGYVSPDGVAQIANIAGISMAKTSSEEGEVQSFIARVLPELLRNSVTDITWTSANTNLTDVGILGIEDKFTIGMKPEVGKVLSETLVPSDDPYEIPTTFLPADLTSVTQYNLKDPQIAWRSVLLTIEKQTDAVSGKLLVAFSGSLFEPYGIENAELFLQSIQPQILTTKFDSEGDKVVVIALVKDAAKIKSSIAKEINFAKPPEKVDSADVWKSEDGEYAAAFTENVVVLGNAESVLACLHARINYEKIPGYPLQFSDKGVSVSWARDLEIAGKIVEVLADKKSETGTASSIYITETRFNQNSIERSTLSDLGLIGSIIEQLGKE